jgi:glycyl-tRNA synthetase (class II)
MADGSVTLRSRDSMQQERVPGDRLAAHLRERLW